MNSEEFINKHLVGVIRSEHRVAISIAKNIIDKTVESYRESRFNDLRELVRGAEEKIRSATSMISELSESSGLTAQSFAESQGVSVATARKRLNESIFASKNCDKKPYIYALIDNG